MRLPRDSMLQLRRFSRYQTLLCNLTTEVPSNCSLIDDKAATRSLNFPAILAISPLSNPYNDSYQVNQNWTVKEPPTWCFLVADGYISVLSTPVGSSVSSRRILFWTTGAGGSSGVRLSVTPTAIAPLLVNPLNGTYRLLIATTGIVMVTLSGFHTSDAANWTVSEESAWFLGGGASPPPADLTGAPALDVSASMLDNIVAVQAWSSELVYFCRRSNDTATDAHFGLYGVLRGTVYPLIRRNASAPKTCSLPDGNCSGVGLPFLVNPTAMAIHVLGRMVYVASSRTILKIQAGVIGNLPVWAVNSKTPYVFDTEDTPWYSSLRDSSFRAVRWLDFVENTLYVFDSSNAVVYEVDIVDRCPDGYAGPPACNSCADGYRRDGNSTSCRRGCTIDLDCSGRADSVTFVNDTGQNMCLCRCWAYHDPATGCSTCVNRRQNYTNLCLSCQSEQEIFPGCGTPTATDTKSHSSSLTISSSVSVSLTALSLSASPTGPSTSVSTSPSLSANTVSLSGTSTVSPSTSTTLTARLTPSGTISDTVTKSSSHSESDTPIPAFCLPDYSLSAESLRGFGDVGLRTLRLRLEFDEWDPAMVDGRPALDTLAFVTLLNTTGGPRNLTRNGFDASKGSFLRGVNLTVSENNTVLTVALYPNRSYAIQSDEQIRIFLPARYTSSKRELRPGYVDVVIVADTPPSSNPVPIPQGVAASAQAVSVAATMVSGSLVGTSTSASLVARSNLILQMSQCNFDPQSPVDFMTNPTTVRIGTEAPYYSGAAVMNVVVAVAFAAVHFSAAFLVHKIKRLPSIYAGMSKVFFPYYFYFVALLLLQPTVMSAVTVLFEVSNPAEKAAAVLSLLITTGTCLQMFWMATRRFRCSFTPWKKTNPVKNFFVGPGKWVDDSETGDHNASSGVDPQGDYVRLYGTLFEDYASKRYWFVIVEVVLNFIAGVIEGVHPSPGHCQTFAIATAVFYTLYLVFLAIFRPHVAMVNTVLVWLISILQTTAVWLIAVAPLDDGAVAAATSLSLLSMYVIGVKTLFDLLMMILDRVCKVVRIHDNQVVSKSFNQERLLEGMEHALAIAEMTQAEQDMLIEAEGGDGEAIDVFATLDTDPDGFIELELARAGEGRKQRVERGGVEGNFNPLNDDEGGGMYLDPFMELENLLGPTITTRRTPADAIVAESNALLHPPQDVTRSSTTQNVAFAGPEGKASPLKLFAGSGNPILRALRSDEAAPPLQGAPRAAGSQQSVPVVEADATQGSSPHTKVAGQDSPPAPTPPSLLQSMLEQVEDYEAAEVKLKRRTSSSRPLSALPRQDPPKPPWSAPLATEEDESEDIPPPFNPMSQSSFKASTSYASTGDSDGTTRPVGNQPAPSKPIGQADRHVGVEGAGDSPAPDLANVILDELEEFLVTEAQVANSTASVRRNGDAPAELHQATRDGPPPANPMTGRKGSARIDPVFPSLPNGFSIEDL